MTIRLRLLIGVALVATLTACGGSAGTDVTTGGDDQAEAPADDTADDSDDTEDDEDDMDDRDDSDETSMPADEDVQHDGSISQAEAEAVANAYLGLTEAEAEAQAQVDDRPFRVGARDGEQFMLTEDYVVGRITVTITDGVVTGATVEATDGPVTVEG